MVHKHALTQIAEDIAADLHSRKHFLKNKITEIEAQLSDAKAAFHAADIAQGRLLKFAPTDGHDLQCPACWITDGVRTALKPVDNPESDDVDHFKCPACGQGYEVLA